MRDQQEQNRLVEQGMQLAAKLPDIMPDDASEQIKPIYKDIQHTLRVPVVNLIFRTLANYPDYFEYMWQHFSPAFGSNQFEQEADNLREKALLETVPDATGANWNALQELEKLRAFNDTIFYVLPKLLLISTTFYEATFRSIPEARVRGGSENAESTQIPLGVAEGTTKVDMVDPESAPDRTKRLFDAIKDKHGHPLVSSYYRGIANWPDFLEEAWQKIESMVGSDEYVNVKTFLTDQAQSSLRRIPLQQPSQKSWDSQQLEEIKAILAAFRYKFIPEMLIDVALIKAMLDGVEEAYTSRFSAAVSED